MKKLGILASHRGTNFQAIIDACRDGHLKASPVIAISNNSKSVALERAKKAGIATAHLSNLTHQNPEDLDQAMLKLLDKYNVDLVVTVGYMRKLGNKILQRYAGRIVNVHPSLLPKYGGQGMHGMHVHNAVIQNGDTETGVTVHWVEGEYDTGPVIAQQVIPVKPGDTAESLAERVLESEHKLLINTLVKLTE